MKSFCRGMFSLECNQLATQMQGIIRDCGVEEMRQLHSSYISLWDKVRGLPPTTDNLPTELSAVCGIYQLLLVLKASGCVSMDTRHTIDWYTQQYTTVIERTCRDLEVPFSLDTFTLPTLAQQLRQSGSHMLMRTLSKLTFIRAILLFIAGRVSEVKAILSSIQSAHQDTKDYGEGIFEQVLHIKYLMEDTYCTEDCNNCAESELVYLKAWRLYHSGQHQEALATLLPLLHTPTPSHITTTARLLAGGCYTKMHKPNLALCSYHQCVSSSSSDLALLPALHNCVGVYRSGANSQAEMEMRKLLGEALRLKEDGLYSGDKPVLLWRSVEGSVALHVPQTPELTLLHAVYQRAQREMQLSRYKEAAASFMEIIQAEESGTKFISPSLPPPSTLSLLCIKASVCSGGWNQAEALSSKLINTLLPKVNSFLTAGDTSPPHGGQQHHREEALRHAVVLAQTFYLRGFAAVQLHRVTNARHYWERCLKLVRFLLRLTGTEQPTTLRCIKQLQVHTVNNLAVVSLCCHGDNATAMQLLAETLATSDVLPQDCAVFNYCLLLGKIGRMGDAAHSWLQHRGECPVTIEEARQRLTEARRTLATLNRAEQSHQFTAMDIAMLTHWIRHTHRQKPTCSVTLNV